MSRKRKALVDRTSTKESHGIFQMIPFSCFTNNKVILVRYCDKGAQFFFTGTFCSHKRFVAVNMFSLVFVSIKHVPGRFSENPLNTDTRIIRTPG